MESMPNQIRFIPGIFLFSLLLLASSAGATAPLADYASRIERARAAVAELMESDSPDGLSDKISALRRLVPRQEEVQFDGQVVRVDNSWLHHALDEAAKKPLPESGGRRKILAELADRLSALQERVRRSQEVAKSDDQSARLESILARPEYRLDAEEESTVKNLFREVRDAIYRFLASLALRSSADPGLPATGFFSVFRLLLLLIVLAASFFGILHLAKRLQRKRRQEEVQGGREILGEDLAGDVTAADLLAKATELAKQGDYRTAIRRAYIALLLELELRGHLPLRPSKTNRDYIDDMRSQHELFPTFATMTGTFETTWYGQRGATEDEFNGFISGYDKTVGSRQKFTTKNTE
jgi:Domain of unknown function (DUF4129)